MNRALGQASVLVVLFFGTWFGLSRIDFVRLFGVEQLSAETEHKLGGFFLDMIKKNQEELESDTVRSCLEDIKHRLCAGNGISDTSITLLILNKDNVNAFAIPDRHIVVYSSLIRYCRTPGELAGVLAHETAHVEHGHVTKKLLSEVGMAMLMTMAGGESGGEIGRGALRILSSTSFDRDLETDADRTAVHMMAAANIDPEEFANFLFRISGEKNNIPRRFVWLSTHPDAADRAAGILNLRKNETWKNVPVMDSLRWERVQKIVQKSLTVN